MPEVAYQPTVHNPFPQLSKVAVAPFFNLSSEPTVDGRQFAAAYFNELQLVPGFEVVPVGVVEQAMRDHGIELSSAEDARRLAQLLEVDAIVIGAVTDYSPYYPPRCAMRVEWYAANPCFHPIPPGYGLPWGTPEESEIPGSLIFEAEMALAREQLKTQTPAYIPAASGPDGATNPVDKVLPKPWPDPSGFIPPPPQPAPPPCLPTAQPVLTHTRSYNGHDADFTEALQTYYFFRDDARFGGWQSYLQRSDDFIRFCCHMHIWEMLSARGGAGETRVVWRWPIIR
ncbi:MAG TPA: hypothetical protein EYP56_19815 [Planctomycetaceae bacterium]|nr:hypothetical protein [Planctomycetaceae bacterium]HIQ21179.1 hypothetical protein [Planctomycetota bacterium]